MTKLYDLSEEYRTIQLLLESGDCDQEELEARLERVEGTIHERMEGLACLVRELEISALAAKDEAARLAKRADSFARNADRLKAWMQRYLEDTGMEKPIKGTRFTVGLNRCPPSVRVLDERAIPEPFWRVVPQTKTIDKRAILEAYQRGGEIVDGTDIVTDKKTLSIR